MTVKEANRLTLGDISRQMGLNLPQERVMNEEGEETINSEYLPDLATEHPPDSQPIARKPQLKFILILMGVSAVVGLFALFMMGSGGNQQVSMPKPTPTPSYVDDKEQEIAFLKSQMSIEAQKQALAGNPTPIPTPTPTPSVATSTPTTTSAIVAPENLPTTTSPTTPPVTPAPRTVRARSSTQREPVADRANRSYSPPSSDSRGNYATPVTYRGQSLPPPRFSPVPDPRGYSRQPTYNRPLPSSVSRSLRRDTQGQSQPIAKQQQEIASLKQQQEIASLKQQISQLKENQPNNPAVTPQTAPPQPDTGTNPKPTIEPVEPVQPTTIPQTTPAEPVIPPPILAIGSRVRGRLISPLQISQSQPQGSTGQGDTHQVFVQTTEAITTTQGWQIPPGAIVAMKVGVADNGLVTGESQGVWYGNHPVNLTVGALSLSSVSDEPLIAQAIAPNSGNISRAENEAMLWGVVGQVGHTLSQPDSQISINNGGTITTATNNKPNIIGAVLDGAFNSKAEARKEEARKRRELALSRPPIWNLPAKTEVMLIANAPDSDRALISAQVPTNSFDFQSVQPPLAEQTQPVVVPEEGISEPSPSSTTAEVLDSQQLPDSLMFLETTDEVESMPPQDQNASDVDPNSEPTPVDCPDTWGNRSYPHVCE
ncbi:hypothetical protein [Merismopedia glauca]|uniref:Uncharacterized protein n=1 Tax=Merismopedia glauca CCAP 1448/3 TaxID=1296344 RepID=A0A2T1C2F3_9CYAN|nr:hypothetical protein [Merismopedia glauca]PSB02384.1 hypothetical protein C7B64_13440 [Merismopedia glauca CCAP 1448/3]